MQFFSAKLLTVVLIGALALLPKITLAQQGALSIDIIDAESQRAISGVVVNITSRNDDATLAQTSAFSSD